MLEKVNLKKNFYVTKEIVKYIGKQNFDDACNFRLHANGPVRASTQPTNLCELLEHFCSSACCADVLIG